MRIFLLLLGFLFICLTKSNSQSYFRELEREERKDKKIVYWGYGLPNFEKAYAKEKAARQFGFYFNHVAGCVVSDKTVDRINKHNKKVNRILSSKIGHSWKNIVYDLTDSIYTIDTTLITNTYLNKEVIDAIMKLDDELKAPFEFRVTPTADPAIFFIDAFIINTEGWIVTDISALKIKATYPNITYELVKKMSGETVTMNVTWNFKF